MLFNTINIHIDIIYIYTFFKIPAKSRKTFPWRKQIGSGTWPLPGFLFETPRLDIYAIFYLLMLHPVLMCIYPFLLSPLAHCGLVHFLLKASFPICADVYKQLQKGTSVEITNIKEAYSSLVSVLYVTWPVWITFRVVCIYLMFSLPHTRVNFLSDCTNVFLYVMNYCYHTCDTCTLCWQCNLECFVLPLNYF